MSKNIESKKAKKIVRWHNNYVVFITPEAKRLGWDENTIVKVFVKDDKIILEKGMRL